jgi:hypothetical protein
MGENRKILLKTMLKGNFQTGDEKCTGLGCIEIPTLCDDHFSKTRNSILLKWQTVQLPKDLVPVNKY